MCSQSERSRCRRPATAAAALEEAAAESEDAVAAVGVAAVAVKAAPEEETAEEDVTGAAEASTGPLAIAGLVQSRLSRSVSYDENIVTSPEADLDESAAISTDVGRSAATTSAAPARAPVGDAPAAGDAHSHDGVATTIQDQDQDQMCV